jgi:hypothetical protein
MRNACVTGRNRCPPMRSGWRRRCHTGTDIGTRNASAFGVLGSPGADCRC